MPITNVCVYGCGVIGSAWAVTFLIKGINVTVFVRHEEKVPANRADIDRALDFFAMPGIDVLSADQLADCKQRLRFTTDIETAVKDAQFIQENGPENIEEKHAIFEAIERFNTDAIIASSTSGLLISDIAAKAAYPERILGGHPYNPVYLIPLVELASGDKTSQKTLDDACEFYKAVGKEPVVLAKECPGFICNRIQMAVNREAQDLVYRGVCSVEDVDKAVTFGPGLRWALMGPHMIQELGGGKEGIRGIMTHIDTRPWYEDMATWTVVPDGYIDIACEGVKSELSKRSAKEGRTHDDLARFRDVGLVNLLKFHDKL